LGRTPSIPPELTRRPFTLDEARNAGLTLSALSGKAWLRVGAELYRWNELPEDPWLTLSAWHRVLPPETVFFGASAAWLHGLDLEPESSGDRGTSVFRPEVADRARRTSLCNSTC
jgi:hypothetical protein